MFKKLLSKFRVSFSTGLTMVLVVLKLTKIINWSWFWVLAPTWFPWAMMGIVALLFMGSDYFKKSNKGDK